MCVRVCVCVCVKTKCEIFLQSPINETLYFSSESSGPPTF